MNRKKKKSPSDIYRERAAQPDFRSFEEISSKFIVFLVLLEDETFFHHKGIDFAEIRGAIRSMLRGGSYGGSTITQQLVKNLYFRFERSYIRKIREMFLALWIERKLTKMQILELYMNVIYYDNGQYGICNASRFYFGKEPAELTLNQAFFLASVLPVVGVYNPLVHPEKFAPYRDRKTELISGALTEKMAAEIHRHGPDRLDEELCEATEELKKYGRKGPMVNERFGPGGPDCLLG